jgi:hypothetical protein
MKLYANGGCMYDLLDRMVKEPEQGASDTNGCGALRGHAL